MDDLVPLDEFTCTCEPGQVVLTLSNVRGKKDRYWISPTDAALIGASLSVNAVLARTTPEEK